MEWFTGKRLLQIFGATFAVVFAGFAICKWSGSYPRDSWAEGVGVALMTAAFITALPVFIRWRIDWSVRASSQVDAFDAAVFRRVEDWKDTKKELADRAQEPASFLLRGSEPAVTSAEQLVRPAGGASVPAPDELLRPGGGEP